MRGIQRVGIIYIYARQQTQTETHFVNPLPPTSWRIRPTFQLFYLTYSKAVDQTPSIEAQLLSAMCYVQQLSYGQPPSQSYTLTLSTPYRGFTSAIFPPCFLSVYYVTPCLASHPPLLASCVPHTRLMRSSCAHVSRGYASVCLPAWRPHMR